MFPLKNLARKGLSARPISSWSGNLCYGPKQHPTYELYVPILCVAYGSDIASNVLLHGLL